MAATEGNSPALRAYVAAMTFAAACALVVASLNGGGEPWGPSPVIAAWMLAFFAAAEARPLNWLTRDGGGEVTVSWAFAMGLFLVVPPATGLLGIAAVTLLIDVVRGRQIDRVVFNVSQLIVSLALAAAVLEVLTDTARLPSDDVDILMWVIASLLGGAVAICGNSAFACVAIALAQGLPISATIRAGFGVNMAMDGLLIALAPVLVMVADNSLVLVPLLLITVMAIFRSSQVALTQRWEASHDLLTELPNRRYFEEQAQLVLSTARRQGRGVAVIQVDLDGFKAINDRLGHHIGDVALQATASRFQSARRAGDIVARFGGDEFVIMVRDVWSTVDALAVADRMLHSLDEPLEVMGLAIQMGGSFGVSLFPEHGDDLRTLLQQADTAMYRVKALGGGVAVFTPEADGKGPGRLELVADLPRALADGELLLAFQPQFDVATATMVAAEALLRWKHPILGMIGPDEYIAAAEQTEVITSITTFVVEAALGAVAELRRQGSSITIAVNVSALDVQNKEFPARVAAAVAARSVPASALEIEITEHALMSQPVRSLKVLSELRAMGIRVALDDFGTGYSSMTNLRLLPVDRLKIDRSFVRNLATDETDEAIVAALVGLGHRLGLTVVAEGVEDEAALDRLRQLGCDLVQGFHLATPMSFVELTELASLGSTRQGEVTQ